MEVDEFFFFWEVDELKIVKIPAGQQLPGHLFWVFGLVCHSLLHAYNSQLFLLLSMYYISILLLLFMIRSLQFSASYIQHFVLCLTNPAHYWSILNLTRNKDTHFCSVCHVRQFTSIFWPIVVRLYIKSFFWKRLSIFSRYLQGIQNLTVVSWLHERLDINTTYNC